MRKTSAILFLILFFCLKGISQSDDVDKKFKGCWEIQKYIDNGTFDGIDTTLLVLDKKCFNNCTNICFSYILMNQIIFTFYDFREGKSLKAGGKFTRNGNVYILPMQGYGTYYFKPVSVTDISIHVEFWRIPQKP